MDRNIKDILDTVNFIKDHMLTKDEGATKEQVAALHAQVNSIEKQLRSGRYEKRLGLDKQFAT